MVGKPSIGGGGSWSKTGEEYLAEIQRLNEANERLLEGSQKTNAAMGADGASSVGGAFRWIVPDAGKTPWTEAQYKQAVAELEKMRDTLLAEFQTLDTRRQTLLEGTKAAAGGSAGTGSAKAPATIADIAAELDLGSVASVHLIYAKLQLTQAMVAKSGAQQYMKKIEANQNEQKTVSEMLNRIRSGQADAKGKKGAATDGSWALPGDIKDYMKANGMSCPTGKNGKFTSDELEAVAESFRTQQDKLSSSTQMDMVYVNDFMGQYNAFLQGANAAISKCIELLSELARGLR
ncbi:MAG: hypothetical protein LBD42_05680 [Desulfovibrio sp.]|jgi:hypothetical protein|nr:hypothetical protein [Desulfovibrio sp.]